MGTDDHSAAPTLEEIARFELMKPARWEPATYFVMGQLAQLIPLSLDVDWGWLQKVEHNPRWRRHYADIVAEAEARRHFLIELAVQFNPRFAGLEPHEVLFESDDLARYVLPMQRRFKLPQPMIDAANRSLVQAVNPPAAPLPVPLQNKLIRQQSINHPSPVGERGKQHYKDVLDAVIDEATRRALDPDDYNAIWAQLVQMAKERIPPLLGIVDGEGIKYEAAEGIKIFSKKNLRDRRYRAQRRKPC
ncbi:hypothetical protein BH160DRAFT_4553 [Burkholderia sp. H160]|nr:hypothetical protein BH160DRAFT_4553 [Burkholderia sp. H160]